MNIITQILASITTVAFLFFGLVKVMGVPRKMFELQNGKSTAARFAAIRLILSIGILASLYLAS